MSDSGPNIQEIMRISASNKPSSSESSDGVGGGGGGLDSFGGSGSGGSIGAATGEFTEGTMMSEDHDMVSKLGNISQIFNVPPIEIMQILKNNPAFGQLKDMIENVMGAMAPIKGLEASQAWAKGVTAHGALAREENNLNTIAPQKTLNVAEGGMGFASRGGG